MRVVRNNMKNLGIVFDVEGKRTKAWEEVGAWVRQILGLWGMRDLSFLGKVKLVRQSR